MVDGQVEKLVLNFFLGYTSHKATSEGCEQIFSNHLNRQSK